MSYGFAAFDEEYRLIKRMKEHGTTIWTDDTSVEDRRDRVRRVMLVNGLGDIRFGRRADGSAETFAEAFARVYLQPLIPTLL